MAAPIADTRSLMHTEDASDILPCPHFEGVEKRVEIDFHQGRLQRGMRSLPRTALDDAMTAAQCLIVSKRTNAAFDAYVLSESSLFVYPTKVVLKTCGTTKLLDAVPLLLAEAAAIGMVPRRCKYTRSTFLFPDEQPLDGDFDAETTFLEEHFGRLGPDGGNAFVLGSKLRGVQWHVYLADDNGGDAGEEGGGAAVEGSECSTQDAPAAGPEASSMPAPNPRAEPTVSLEVCMTHLDVEHSKHFVRDDTTFVSSRQTTQDSGIAALFPTMDIDDYVFEPCGYSMNGLAGSEYSTIHITPENGFSYCSVEHSNVPVSVADPEAFVRRVASTFKPGKFSLAVSTDAALTHAADIRRVPTLPGYRRVQASHQEVDANGGTVSFYTFVRLPETTITLIGVAAAIKAVEDAREQKELVKSVVITEGDGKYESDEEAPSRKKLRPEGSSSPCSLFDLSTDSRSTTPSLLALLSAGGANSASVTNLVAFGARTVEDTIQPSVSARNPMTEFAGVATLRSSLLTPRPLAAAFVLEAPVVIQALVESSAKSLSGGGERSVDNCILDVIEDDLSLPSAERLERFLVLDLGVVMRRWHYWRAVLPRVQPHYAVKCNMDVRMLATLAALGCNFDCASPTEVEAVMNLGVSPDRIIYANPCKLPRHLVAAAGRGVSLTTFDSEGELHKIASLAPDMRVLLRVRADDPDARCVLGNKYGAEPAEVEPLLRAAQALGVHVAGVAFHVGSGATNPLAFREALEFARVAFDTAARLGLPTMNVLDIGGGFSGAGSAEASAGSSSEKDVTLTAVAVEVNDSLERLFPAAEGVRVISEPGRYFAETCVTLACMVFSRRIRSEASGSLAPGDDSHQYFVSDGLYGMMNSIMYDHATVTSRVLPVATNAAALAAGSFSAIIPPGVNTGMDVVSGQPGIATHPSTVFGPTCDGLDVIHEQTRMPELSVGDWLVFPHMGAYTVSAGSNFNGFSCADVKTFYVCSIDDADPAYVHR
mmetsp:Transcript_33607/g.53897  ORF Transcript_33607/g.53897 Transcript_33607/m.53897 type:complete len:992 (+) Transcript_33607:533-3508(+)